MMQSSGALHAVILSHLVEDGELMAYFRSTMIEGQTWPQFSFDGLTSSWRHESIGLVSHQIDFSVWAELLAFGDLNDVTELLALRMKAPFSVQGYLVVDLNLNDFSSVVDERARLRSNRLGYRVLTQQQAEA